jgi:tetratricopeptide (TPR) repeat protein
VTTIRMEGPRHRAAPLRLLGLAAVAFAVAVAVLVLAHRDATAPRPGLASLSLSVSAPGLSTDARIARLQALVRAQPHSVDGLSTLAAAYLQKVRETADPAYYSRAELALRRALGVRRDDAGALTERGALELSRHDFRAALADGRRVRALAPEVNKPFGVLVDALVELGRYREAGRALQAMVDRDPNLGAYARVSYFRELHGDLTGAARALQLAIAAGGDVPENAAYVQSLAGDLDLVRGRPAAAGRAYREALAQLPHYGPALFGLARVDAARGRVGRAIARLRTLTARLPLPAYVVALGDFELAAGRGAAARHDLALVGIQERLLRAAGVNTDVDLALYEADHGSPRRGVVLARRAWAQAPSVRSADALGWALTRAGRPRPGLVWARRALRLGSRDPSFLYHAGSAAAVAGERAAARVWLARVVGQAPRFSPLYGPRAARLLEALR